ncbi:MAG: 4Fe-4S dicluster domain-containing protein [Victivallaceae bacterium]|nr:4Fe-4S dicluster domain-containing protein [Victivallaceae bacterium]
MSKKFRVQIEFDQCKGCGRCVLACPKHLLKIGSKLNVQGYAAAYYVGEGCIGCGGCFFQCPEPGAVTVYEEVEE